MSAHRADMAVILDTIGPIATGPVATGSVATGSVATGPAATGPTIVADRIAASVTTVAQPASPSPVPSPGVTPYGVVACLFFALIGLAVLLLIGPDWAREIELSRFAP